MVAAGEITHDSDLLAALLSESLSELSSAVAPEKVGHPSTRQLYVLPVSIKI